MIFLEFQVVVVTRHLYLWSNHKKLRTPYGFSGPWLPSAVNYVEKAFSNSATGLLLNGACVLIAFPHNFRRMKPVSDQPHHVSFLSLLI
jgi:hypothetical protein